MQPEASVSMPNSYNHLGFWSRHPVVCGLLVEYFEDPQQFPLPAALAKIVGSNGRPEKLQKMLARFEVEGHDLMGQIRDQAKVLIESSLAQVGRYNRIKGWSFKLRLYREHDSSGDPLVLFGVTFEDPLAEDIDEVGFPIISWLWTRGGSDAETRITETLRSAGIPAQNKLSVGWVENGNVILEVYKLASQNEDFSLNEAEIVDSILAPLRQITPEIMGKVFDIASDYKD